MKSPRTRVTIPLPPPCRLLGSFSLICIFRRWGEDEEEPARPARARRRGLVGGGGEGLGRVTSLRVVSPPASPKGGGRKRKVTSCGPRVPSRLRIGCPGPQSLPRPALTGHPPPARGCRTKAPRRCPRRVRKPGGFASAAGAASGPPARAPWRGAGCGGGRLPGCRSHFCRERCFCQERTTAAAAIFRGLKMAAALLPANQGNNGRLLGNLSPAPSPRPSRSLK